MDILIIIGLIALIGLNTMDLIDLRRKKKLLVKYHTDAARPIQQAHEGEWIDLRVAEDVFMKKGEYKAVSLGISICLPKGYEAHVAPRSSMFKNHQVIQTNSVGIIDNKYCGNNDIISIPLVATGDTLLLAGERIAQMKIVRQQGTVKIKEVDNLAGEDRGGFGSTGRK